MVFFALLALILFSFLLVKSADHIVIAVRRLSGSGGKAFAVSAIIIAVGTSFPEISVAITSALAGTPTVSLGNAMGANIVNLSLATGFVSLLIGNINFGGSYHKKEMYTGLVAGILPLLLLLDGTLSRIDGIILLSVYVVFALSFLRSSFKEIVNEHREESFVYRFFRRFSHIDAKKSREFGRFFVALVVILFSAGVVVKLANFLATGFGVPSLVTGLVFVALGTSLPELAFSLRSLEDHEPSMFVGNLIGSIVANSTLVIGLASIIHPIEVVAVNKYYPAIFFFIIIYLCFWLFTKSKHRLDRWESMILLLLYVAFLVVEFL